jgi:hypothetical protein
MKHLYFIIIGIALLNTANGQTDSKQTFSVGDHYGGGIVFSLDATGRHGLVAALFDLPERACWGEDGMSSATYMNEGNLNTEKIIAFIKTMRQIICKLPAACMCDTLSIGGYSDWYLPSINELKEMYDKQRLIGNFIAGDYVSSTECNYGNCWSVHFKPSKNVVYKGGKLNNNYQVRCIRKF